MEKDRSRGLKHIKDKRKYKGNTNKNPKYVPQKTQPNLGSNWDRYENEEADGDQNILGTDTDFAILAEAPIAKGKHFQSKSDKLLASETESASLSVSFTLDLHKLEESLLTIPFYTRMGIDKNYFLENEIEFMNQEADEKLKRYFENNRLTESGDSCVGQSEDTDEEDIPSIHNQVDETNTSVNQEKSAELEQWLDDFLNE